MASSASASTLGSTVTSLLDSVTPSQLAQPEAKADEWWSQYSNVIYDMLHTGTAAGMCTDYVSARRPDVIERVEKLVVVKHVLTNQNGQFSSTGWPRTGHATLAGPGSGWDTSRGGGL